MTDVSNNLSDGDWDDPLAYFEQSPDPQFGFPVVNATDIPNGVVFAEVERSNRSVLTAMSDWAQSTRLQSNAVDRRNGGLFERDKFIMPNNIKRQMELAYDAVGEDDIISGAADSTESLAFSAVSMFSQDMDEQDIYNQIARDIQLDARLREIWHELFTVSQCYVAVWWGQKSYTVRGKGEARRRRKTFTLQAPQSLTLLDPLKVVPVGPTVFGLEKLAYVASSVEHERFQEIVAGRRAPGSRRSPDPGDGYDPIVERLMVEWYKPDRAEQREIQQAGFEASRLWLLNPANVFRHTLTRPGFRRWSPIRLKSIFELLDRKSQLRQMDRAHLIGGTNFIVLVTKGSDQLPATPPEISNLQAQVRTVARLPVLVGDHRLNVEIVTPKLDNTLKAERYNTIDSRITARVYQMFMLGNYSAGASSDKSEGLVKVIARGLESRRHMIRRTLEQHIWEPMFQMNETLEYVPKLVFHPRSIALDFDQAWASFLLELRMNKEISRDTLLTQFDLNQNYEYLMRVREAEMYDDTFQTQVAFSSPNPVEEEPARRDNGGGNRNGGGAAPGTGQGQEPRNPMRRSDGRTQRADLVDEEYSMPEGDGYGEEG